MGHIYISHSSLWSYSKKLDLIFVKQCQRPSGMNGQPLCLESTQTSMMLRVHWPDLTLACKTFQSLVSFMFAAWQKWVPEIPGYHSHSLFHVCCLFSLSHSKHPLIEPIAEYPSQLSENGQIFFRERESSPLQSLEFPVRLRKIPVWKKRSTTTHYNDTWLDQWYH